MNGRPNVLFFAKFHKYLRMADQNGYRVTETSLQQFLIPDSLLCTVAADLTD